MTLKHIFTKTLFLLSTIIFSQNHPLLIPSNINLPKDTIVSSNLIESLNGFLSQKENENKTNTYVLSEDLLETSILLDEMKGIEKSGKYKDDNFFKGYLNNVVTLDKNNFLIQFSYIGINQNTAVLRASFEVLTKLKDSKFYFLSPLKRNTISWKVQKTGNIIFHYKNTLNQKRAKEYVKSVALLDAKLQPQNNKIEWYGCTDLTEILNSIGVAYKLDYNAEQSSTFSAFENGTCLLVDGLQNEHFDSFDPHDLWHDRLHNVYPRSSISQPVDEGCAYLYGGSWGISWQQIMKIFKDKVASNPKTDWLEQAYYETDQINFGESKQKHLMADYVINALLVQKIEKEKGFNGVVELLCSGQNKKGGNENYFKILEKLTGITKANFNESVWALIEQSK